MKNIDKLSFGDIALANVIFTDGSESKLRPVLILYKNGEDYIVLKMSSQTITSDTLIIRPDTINNLKIDTSIDLKKISSFHKTLFVKFLGSISTEQNNLIKSYRSQFPSQR